MEILAQTITEALRENKTVATVETGLEFCNKHKICLNLFYVVSFDRFGAVKLQGDNSLEIREFIATLPVEWDLVEEEATTVLGKIKTFAKFKKENITIILL